MTDRDKIREFADRAKALSDDAYAYLDATKPEPVPVPPPPPNPPGTTEAEPTTETIAAAPLVFPGIPGLTDTSNLSRRDAPPHDYRQLKIIGSQGSDTRGKDLVFLPYGGGLYVENVHDLELGDIRAEGIHALRFEKTTGKVGDVVHLDTRIGVHVGDVCRLDFKSIVGFRTKDPNGNGDTIIVNGKDSKVVVGTLRGEANSDCDLDCKGEAVVDELLSFLNRQSSVKCWGKVTIGRVQIIEPLGVGIQAWAGAGQNALCIIGGGRITHPANPRTCLKVKNEGPHKATIRLHGPLVIELKPEHKSLKVDHLINWQGGTVEGKEWIKIV
jgi:hypothetical protein